MPADELDITGLLTWEEGLPRPKWDLLESWVESRCDTDGQRALWTSVLRQWIAELGAAIGHGYSDTESENFLAIAWQADEFGDALLQFAESCRASLLSVLGGVANFDLPGKQVLVALRSTDDYYRYISLYFPEGEHGGSG